MPNQGTIPALRHRLLSPDVSAHSPVQRDAKETPPSETRWDLPREEREEAAVGLRGVDERRASPAGRLSVQKETGYDGGPNRCSAAPLSSQRATVPGQPATLPPHRCYSPKKIVKKKERRSEELSGVTAFIKQGGGRGKEPFLLLAVPPRLRASISSGKQVPGMLFGVSFVPTRSLSCLESASVSPALRPGGGQG